MKQIRAKQNPLDGWKRFMPAFALLPSFLVLLYGLDLPHLCHMKDDGVYLATAFSIANGEGYRIASLPGSPWNVKYPPLYPLLLSAAFFVGRSLEQSLALANLLNWMALPVFALLTFILSCRLGCRSPAIPVLVCLSYWGTTVAAHSLLSDLWGSVAALAALLAVQRSPVRASLFAMAACLIRASSWALIMAITVEYLAQRRFRIAVLFFGLAAVPLLLWTVWASSHVRPLSDYNDQFMSTYADVLAYEHPRSRVPERIGLQLKLIGTEIGGVLLPWFVGGDALNPVRLALGAASLGTLAFLPRLFRMFVLMYLLQLTLWPWIPFERFFVQIVPFLSAGSAIAISRWTARHPVWAPASVVVSWFAILLVSAEAANALLVNHYRLRNTRMAPVYEWIRQSTPPDSTFSAYSDAVLFFRTGRRAETLHCSVREDWENPGASLRRTLGLADWSLRRGHRYVLLTPWDYGLSRENLEILRRNLESRGRLVMAAEGIYVFELMQSSSGTMAMENGD